MKDRITIDGIEYVRADLMPASKPLGPVQIVVADRGWIFVGNVEEHPDKTVTISNCRNIRRWGTTKGLGELENGPLPSTVADPYPDVRCTPILQIAVVRGW